MDQIEKLYYSIGEVADILGESTSCIRFWTNEFFVETRRTQSDNVKGTDRRYSLDAIEKLKDVQYLVRKEGVKHWKVRQLMQDVRVHVKPIILKVMSKEEKKTLWAMGRHDIVATHEVLMTGFAGIDPRHPGAIVDRRVCPEAIPIAVQLAGSDVELPHVMDVTVTEKPEGMGQTAVSLNTKYHGHDFFSFRVYREKVWLERRESDIEAFKKDVHQQVSTGIFRDRFQHD